MSELRKYPRTRHIEGSRLQPGDEDLHAVPWAELRGAPLVVEEKLDGANAGLSFAADGTLRLQSRGHFLTGGARERHFALFKTWAQTHQRPFFERLGARYVVYGEWLYAKHTIFYDRLPHFFMEFDVLDLERDVFLDTPARHALLDGLPIESVPVLHRGALERLDALTALVARSLYKGSGWRDALIASARSLGQSPELVRDQTDPSDDAEGLYVKLERDGVVAARFKWIRPSFLTAVVDSGSHWLRRPILPNQLAPGADPFAS